MIKYSNKRSQFPCTIKRFAIGFLGWPSTVPVFQIIKEKLMDIVYKRIFPGSHLNNSIVPHRNTKGCFCRLSTQNSRMAIKGQNKLIFKKNDLFGFY